MQKIIVTLICIVSYLLLAGCVTAIDNNLPYKELPEITVATQFNLVASSSHPTAYLAFKPIPSGAKIQIIGTDKNAAWLLVAYNNKLGWMPTFYSRTNVSTLKPAIVVEPLSDKCTKYLGATYAPDEKWTSTASSSVFIVGSIYRSQTGKQFDGASLVIEIGGKGKATIADYIHTPLAPSSAIVLFVFSVEDLQKDSVINFRLMNSGNESLSFEAAFFSNDCHDAIGTSGNSFKGTLPIGKTKLTTLVPNSKNNSPTPTQQSSAPKATPTPVVISVTQEHADIPSKELRVGQSRIIDNLEFRLDHVEVGTSDVNTKFYVTNKGKTEVTFDTGPEMGYFVLSDNKGRAWSPVHIPSSTITLATGQTSGDIGPRFDGHLLSDSGVTQLLLKVEGIKDSQPITWLIDLNSLGLPSSSDTQVDTILQVGKRWYYRGLIFYLDRVEINTNDVNTKFYVTNETDAPLVFEPHYDKGYFTLIDNKGRSWSPINDYTDRIVLNPGQTSGDIGPRFNGSLLVDQGVQKLTLVFDGLFGVSKAKWVFDVNVQSTDPKLTNTPTGKLLTVGQPWRHNDLVLRLDRVEIGSSDLNTKFYVTNKTDSTFVFEHGQKYSYFSLTDNKGREWPLVTIPEGKEVLRPEAVSTDLGPRFGGEFLKDPEVTYVILTVKNLLGISEAKWKIDIVR